MRSAPFSFAPSRFVSHKSTPSRFIFDKSIPDRSAPFRARPPSLSKASIISFLLLNFFFAPPSCFCLTDLSNSALSFSCSSGGSDPKKTSFLVTGFTNFRPLIASSKVIAFISLMIITLSSYISHKGIKY